MVVQSQWRVSEGERGMQVALLLAQAPLGPDAERSERPLANAHWPWLLSGFRPVPATCAAPRCVAARLLLRAKQAGGRA